MKKLVRLAAFAAVLPLCVHAGPLEDGLRAHARGDWLEAVRMLLPLAQAGDAEAQTRIGVMYFRGLGLREDDAAAFDWLRRAALQGHAEAQYHLGNLYAFGHGVPADDPDADRMAARWYFEAAQQGRADAQYALGLLFLAGKGVLQSEQEAVKWLQRAAAGGHEDARRYFDLRER